MASGQGTCPQLSECYLSHVSAVMGVCLSGVERCIELRWVTACP